MYCDFCSCEMCKTGIESVFIYHGDDPVCISLAASPVNHTQCEDGRWICSTCYIYECCVEAGSDPCSGLCGEYKCEHRPKLVNKEWTFWTYHLGLNINGDDYIGPGK
jgi:hypothetical protein